MYSIVRCTLIEASPSSSSVRVICVEFASTAFSISSLSVDGMSRTTWPLDILLTVFESSFVIIFKTILTKIILSNE
jgi:hypothetical protein